MTYPNYTHSCYGHLYFSSKVKKTYRVCSAKSSGLIINNIQYAKNHRIYRERIYTQHLHISVC